MASSSSFSVQQKKYEVFLSLCKDTRNNFASHLHAALNRYQINTFVYCPLEGGGEETFMLAIEESKVSVIVVSKDYVSSSWCLEKLCKILECKEKNGLKVVPIFYYVDPSHVKRAFEKHEECFMDETDKVERWKAALFGVANLAGFNLDEEEDRLETELIEDIVKFIWEQLNELSSDIEGLVGMDSRIEKLEELLDHMEPKGVRIIGIWGMPGVGKTTTADVFFKHISCQFDASYFLANVREKSMSQGLECLRNELFPVLKKDPRIDKIGSCITNWHRPRKVLLVLDDVNNSEQVRYLIGDQTCFGPGSTIIVTSRDREVLRLITDVIYTVEKLTYDQAIEFCNQFAFGGNHSISIEQTMELSRWVVHYADGIPLALKILGCFLYDEKEGTLDSALRRLEKAPNKEIHQLFSISYDGLKDEEKRIFLDVACFFEGEDKNRVADILDGCGFSAHLGITVLNDWFLLIILNNNLQMHRLAQVMGWEIVRRESEHPDKRSRLWRYEDIIDVVTTNKGTETVEGIFLNMTEVEKPICINLEAFSRMRNLRLLKIYGPHSQVDYKVHLPHDFKICSDKLAYLHWHCYPSESLPLNFDPESLVELHMHYSRVIQLWEGTRKLQKLKWIDLSYSKHLKEMPDLSKAPNLVRLNLVGCTSLLEIPSIASFLPNLQAVYLSGCSNLRNFPSLSWNVQELHLDGTAIEEVPAEIQHFSRLVTLNMKNCQRLKKFPRIDWLKSLEYLVLSGCSNLRNFPLLSWNIQELHLDGTAIEEVPAEIQHFSRLVKLNMKNCQRLKKFPRIDRLKSLEYLVLSGCSNLRNFPLLSWNIQELHLDGTAIEEVPAEIQHFSRLVKLNMKNCQRLEKFPRIDRLKSLEYLVLSGCSNLRNFPLLSWNLQELHLDGTAIEEVPAEIQHFSRLIKLNMKNCQRLEKFPRIDRLKSLEYLVLSGCSNLRNFPLLSWNIQELHLDGTAIEEVPAEIQHFRRLVKLNMKNCQRLKKFPRIDRLKTLEYLVLSGCSNLRNFPLLSWNIQELHLDGTAIEEVPAEIQHFSRLVKLNMKNCKWLKKFPRIRWLMSLEYLVLSGCSNLNNFAENQHMDIWAQKTPGIQQRFQSVLELPPNLQLLDAHDCTLLQIEPSSFPICRGWGQKFIFTNCIMLDQNIIRVKTHLRIQQRATADVKLYQKDKKQDLKPGFSSACFCFPGSEIPEWFNSKNLGSSVTTLLPLHLLHHQKLVGFALCAIVAFEECHKDLGFTVKCRCNFKTEGDDCDDCLSNWSVWDKSDSPRFIGSDHVFLGYDFNLYSHWYSGESKYYLNEASFEFSASDSDSGSPLDSCIIKKCGVCLLYAQDDLSESKSDA